MVNLSKEQLGAGMILTFLASMIGFWSASTLPMFWAIVLGATAVTQVFAWMISANSGQRNMADWSVLMVIMLVGSAATWFVVNWFVGLIAPIAIVMLALVDSNRKDKEQKK